MNKKREPVAVERKIAGRGEKAEFTFDSVEKNSTSSPQPESDTRVNVSNRLDGDVAMIKNTGLTVLQDVTSASEKAFRAYTAGYLSFRY